MNSNTTARPVSVAGAAIHSAYDQYAQGFDEITRRARARFEQRDWSGAQADATERLALYKAYVDAAVADVRDILDDAVMERTVWAAMKVDHASRVRAHSLAGSTDRANRSRVRRARSKAEGLGRAP